MSRQREALGERQSQVPLVCVFIRVECVGGRLGVMNRPFLTDRGESVSVVRKSHGHGKGPVESGKNTLVGKPNRRRRWVLMVMYIAVRIETKPPRMGMQVLGLLGQLLFDAVTRVGFLR